MKNPITTNLIADAAGQAWQEFQEIKATDPDAIAPPSFREMVLRELLGETWNITTGEYEPENKNK